MAHDGARDEPMGDRALMLRARSGDTQSLELLWARHQPAALTAAKALAIAADDGDDATSIGENDEWADVERERLGELVAESFAAVFVRLRRGDGPTRSFREMLFRTMRSLAAPAASTPQPDPPDASDDADGARAIADVGAVDGPAGLDAPSTIAALRGGPIHRAFRALTFDERSLVWHAFADSTPRARQAEIAGVDVDGLDALVDAAARALDAAWKSAEPDDGSPEPRAHLASVILPLSLGSSASIAYRALRRESDDGVAPPLPLGVAHAARDAGRMARPWTAIGIGVLTFAVAGALFAAVGIDHRADAPVASSTSSTAADASLAVTGAEVVDAAAGRVRIAVQGEPGRAIAVHTRDDDASGAGGGLSAQNATVLGPRLSLMRLADDGTAWFDLSIGPDHVRANAALAFVYPSSADRALTLSLERLGLLEPLLLALGGDASDLERLREADARDRGLDDVDPDAPSSRIIEEAGGPSRDDAPGDSPSGDRPSAVPVPDDVEPAPSDPAPGAPRPDGPPSSPGPDPQPAPSPTPGPAPAPSPSPAPGPSPAPTPSVPTTPAKLSDATRTGEGLLGTGLLTGTYTLHISGQPGTTVRVTTTSRLSRNPGTVAIGADGVASIAGVVFPMKGLFGLLSDKPRGEVTLTYVLGDGSAGPAQKYPVADVV